MNNQQSAAGSSAVTNFVSRADVEARRAEARHFVIVPEPDGTRRWVIVGPTPLTIGRSAPADIVVPDDAISRAHCRVELIDDHLYVTDQASTNGTFADGQRISAPTPLRSGTVFQIGNQIVGYERRLCGEFEQIEALQRDLQSASRYIQMLLPRPVHEGPVLAEWHFLPCSRVGGDAFGYGPVGDDWWGGFIFDVTGHGASAALHAVTVLDVLRRRAFPGIDLRDPGAVIANLNDMFQAESDEIPLFSVWGFTYQISTRALRYCSAGHHPGIVMTRADRRPIALNTSNPLLGMVPSRKFASETKILPPGAMLYLFSDGAFEVTTSADENWTLKELVAVLGQPPAPLSGEPRRIYNQVRAVARPGPFDDDFSVVVLEFP